MSPLQENSVKQCHCARLRKDTGTTAPDPRPDTCPQGKAPTSGFAMRDTQRVAGKFHTRGRFRFGTAKQGAGMNIQTREMLIDTRTATADRTVAVSISSDIPLDRYDYVEILSHDAKAIDLSRAPLPLVEGHDTSKVNVGIIEGIRTDGKKLRGILRMGASQRATELWADIQSGVVRGLSVGYEILSHTTNGKTVTATRWKPYETSLVAVPADNSVGIG